LPWQSPTEKKIPRRSCHLYRLHLLIP
jgi:hypothetical protein